MNYANNADRRRIEWLSFGSWDDRTGEGRWQVALQAPHDLQRRQPNRFTAGRTLRAGCAAGGAVARRIAGCLLARAASASCCGAPRCQHCRFSSSARVWISGSSICSSDAHRPGLPSTWRDTDIGFMRRTATSHAMHVRRWNEVPPSVNDPCMSLFAENPRSYPWATCGPMPARAPSHCGVPRRQCSSRPSTDHAAFESFSMTTDHFIQQLHDLDPHCCTPR